MKLLLCAAAASVAASSPRGVVGAVFPSSGGSSFRGKGSSSYEGLSKVTEAIRASIERIELLHRRELDVGDSAKSSESTCDCSKDAGDAILEAYKDVVEHIPFTTLGRMEASADAMSATLGGLTYEPSKDYAGLVVALEDLVKKSTTTLDVIHCGPCEDHGDGGNATTGSGGGGGGNGHIDGLCPGISHYECCCDVEFIRTITIEKMYALAEIVNLNPGASPFIAISRDAIVRTTSAAITEKSLPYFDCFSTSQPSDSSAPSSDPSSAPSSDPSSAPSSDPSAFPSAEPSNMPTTLMNDTMNATDQPSEEPSSVPSSSPSTSPSSVQSSSPSESPSARPFASPSSEPSLSAMPSTSERPSGEPSVSFEPSTEPSSVPSSSPSLSPSADPSVVPSESREPSEAPSEKPSEGPSVGSSEQPTEKPSEGPSAQPSGMPSFLSDPDGGNDDFSTLPPSLTVRCIIALQGVFPPRNRRVSDVSYESNYTSEGDDGRNRRSLGGVNPFIGEISWFAGNFAPRGWADCNGQLLPINQNQALFSILGTIYGGDGRTTFALPDLRGRIIHHDGQGPGLSNRPLGQKAGSEEKDLTPVHLPAHTHPDRNGQTSATGLGQSFGILPPYSVTKCIIAIQGEFPSRNRRDLHEDGATDDDTESKNHRRLGIDPFLGEVSWFAGNFPPRGWAECNGQILQISQFNALFSLLGTTYGGDGRVTFALPEARGRMVIHEGQGAELTDRELGDRSGVETQTLETSNLPSHNHDMSVGEVGSGQEFDIMPPFLTLNAVIALQGQFPPRNRRAATEVHTEESTGKGSSQHHRFLGGSNPFLGEIMWVAFNFAPRGWAFCDGQLLPINQNQALFSILGTIYGGDGRSTFALPDLRGRAMTHTGNGPGLTSRAMGEKFGEETHILTLGEMPAHSHYAN